MTDAEAYAGQWVLESEVHNITSGPVETDDGEKRLKHLLVEEGVSANCCAHRGGDATTPLHKAAQQGFLRYGRVLVASGANVHARIAIDDVRRGVNALHLAAYRGYIDFAIFLVRQGVHVLGPDDNGGTPVHHAGCDTVEGRRSPHTTRDVLYLQELSGILSAAQMGYDRKYTSTQLRQVFSEGDVHRNWVHDETLFFEAVMTNDIDTAESYLRQGMSPNTMLRHNVVVGQMAANRVVPGMTAMLIAAKNSHMLELLCRYGGNIHEVHLGTSQTVLFRAASHGLKHVCKTLLEQGADFHCRAHLREPAYGDRTVPTSPFGGGWAMFLPEADRPPREERRAIRKELLLVYQHGPNPTQVAERHWQVLKAFLKAMLLRDLPLVERFLEEKKPGMDVNGRWKRDDLDFHGMDMDETALHMAANGDDIPLMQLLLRHGADIHATNDDGHTPFGLAYLYCKRRAALLLLAHLADARIGNVFMFSYGGYMDEEERPDTWEADGEAIREEWEWSAHPDRKWERRKHFVHVLVCCKFKPLAKDVPTPLAPDVPLPAEAVGTEQDRMTLRLNKVFREVGIVARVASYM